jgi:hypothetical protein
MDHTVRSPEGQGGSPLEAALEGLRRGWSIIPIGPGTKKPPRSLFWKRYQSQRADEAQLRQWFRKGKYGSLGVILGDVSGGLVCRDFDTMESYEQWTTHYPDLAKTLPTVATARGRHVYCRSLHRGIVKLEDGELRGAGYCLLPPSRHPDGPTCRWIVPLPDGPLTLIEDVHAAGFIPFDPS